eukprot:2897334-Prymnesium_polylepis.1
MDKRIIRVEYCDVELVERHTHHLTIDEHNVWLMSLASITTRFITLQGGTSFMFAYFPGVHIVLGAYGSGVDANYRFLSLFSNATIHHAKSNKELVRLARQHF